jgi:D-tyrosyl-tRNA(Tyr) deacylase
MRTVIQRVERAIVRVKEKPVGTIGPGLLVFLGIEKMDTLEDVRWLSEKLPRIRCFEDDAGRMNRSLGDIDGEILLVSQFTLFGSLRKGTRPSFNRAADPDQAIPLYEAFLEKLQEAVGKPVATGVFGAEMKIEAHNDGPVTLVLDTKNKDL